MTISSCFLAQCCPNAFCMLFLCSTSYRPAGRAKAMPRQMEYEVQKIVGERCKAKKMGWKYKIRWKGFEAKDDTWYASVSLLCFSYVSTIDHGCAQGSSGRSHQLCEPPRHILSGRKLKNPICFTCLGWHVCTSKNSLERKRVGKATSGGGVSRVLQEQRTSIWSRGLNFVNITVSAQQAVQANIKMVSDVRAGEPKPFGVRFGMHSSLQLSACTWVCSLHLVSR